MSAVPMVRVYGPMAAKRETPIIEPPAQVPVPVPVIIIIVVIVSTWIYVPV